MKLVGITGALDTDADKLLRKNIIEDYMAPCQSHEMLLNRIQCMMFSLERPAYYTKKLPYFIPEKVTNLNILIAELNRQ